MADIVIIGAGPAGLAAAYELAGRAGSVLVLERDALVGGLSRTVEYKGFRCDIGGHRFFTKSDYVDRLWREVLGPDFLRRPRLSRIYYRGRFFQYPLKIFNALSNLGPWTSLKVLGSFLAARFRRRRKVRTFSEWVSARFGRRLFEMFFRTYTEKIWGMSCDEISADWAAQRIRDLSLGKAILNAFRLTGRRSTASLIDEFDYPVHGPGQMYGRMAELASEHGATVRLNSPVVRIEHAGGRVTAVGVERDGTTERHTVERACFSSMPLDELVLGMTPPPPEPVRRAAAALRYRSLITVNVLSAKPTPLPDTWMYIHDPAINAGRLQFYGNWSPRMVPSPDQAIIGLEYFCTEGDQLWQMNDAQLFDLAMRDLAAMKLIDTASIFGSFSVRYRKAYPVYDEGYRQRLDTIRQWLAAISNLYPMGRYGQFRYNNMDHSILTAHLSVQKMQGGAADPWSVNVEAEGYLEEKSDKPAASIEY